MTSHSKIFPITETNDELDFEVVLETDEITKNTASITAGLIYIKDADYNLYSYSR